VTVAVTSATTETRGAATERFAEVEPIAVGPSKTREGSTRVSTATDSAARTSETPSATRTVAGGGGGTATRNANRSVLVSSSAAASASSTTSKKSRAKRRAPKAASSSAPAKAFSAARVAANTDGIGSSRVKSTSPGPRRGAGSGVGYAWSAPSAYEPRCAVAPESNRTSASAPAPHAAPFNSAAAFSLSIGARALTTPAPAPENSRDATAVFAAHAFAATPEGSRGSGVRETASADPPGSFSSRARVRFASDSPTRAATSPERPTALTAHFPEHAHCAPRTETLAVPSTTSESLVTDATSKPSQLRPVTSTVSGPCVTTWSGMATRRFPSHARTGSSDAPARWGLTTSTSDTAHAHVVAGDAIPPDFDRRARIARARVLR
jgi:hypothetical protein